MDIKRLIKAILKVVGAWIKYISWTTGAFIALFGVLWLVAYFPYHFLGAICILTVIFFTGLAIKEEYDKLA